MQRSGAGNNASRLLDLPIIAGERHVIARIAQRTLQVRTRRRDGYKTLQFVQMDIELLVKLLGDMRLEDCRQCDPGYEDPNENPDDSNADQAAFKARHAFPLLHSISETADSLDEIGSELAPQPADVHLNGIGLAAIFECVEVIDELLLRDHPADPVQKTV